VHACTDPCAGCEDDGNPCTYESCGSGSCEKGDLPYGEACSGADDGNECTVRACDGNGTCTHVPVSEGVSCTNSDVCNTWECNGQGNCAAASPVNGPSCGENPYEEICLDGICSDDVIYVCVGGDVVYGTKTNPWAGEAVYECTCTNGSFLYRKVAGGSVSYTNCGGCMSYPLFDVKVCVF
jgi:hypothetical protein